MVRGTSQIGLTAGRVIILDNPYKPLFILRFILHVTVPTVGMLVDIAIHAPVVLSRLFEDVRSH